MAEKLKPIEGYTITTFPYGETFYLCDTCGMAVAPERTSDHPKFEHTDDHVKPNPMEGYTITELEHGKIAQLCDTCGRAQRWSLGLAGTCEDDHLAAYQQLQLSDRLQKLVTEYGLEAVVQQVGKIRQATPTTPAKKATRSR